MRLKIVCLEEHATDAALGEATRSSLLQQAPYMADLGSRFEEPDTAGGTRPRLQSPGRAAALASAPVSARLEAMDANGIDMQVVSYSDVTQAAPRDQAPGLARAANDRLAEVVRRHPGRFAGFSTLPWQDPDAAVLELERSVTHLGLTATLLIGRPGADAFLDDPRYAPVLAKLEELRAPLYMHPGAPLPAVQRPYYGGLGPEVTARLSLYGWGWHNEAGIQVIRLVLSGALDRHPNLRVISGHWGEMVPFYLQRLDDALPVGATRLSRTVSQTYRDQVFVTPSGMLDLPHFKFIHEVLGADRILFAVDYPYLTMAGARAWLEGLPVGEDERSAIAHRNAEALLRLQR